MDFKQRLCTDYALSEASANLLLQDAERVRLAARTVVEREGQRTPWICFVEQGAVRTYVERGGRCVLLQFAFEGEAVRPDLPADGTARSTVETLEPTVLVPRSLFHRVQLDGQGAPVRTPAARIPATAATRPAQGAGRLSGRDSPNAEPHPRPDPVTKLSPGQLFVRPKSVLLHRI